MAEPWSRVANTTIRKYIREAEDNTLRSRKLSALLQKKGRISYNNSGTELDWKVKYKRVKPSPTGEGDTLEFSRKDRHQTAHIGWRGYAATDAISKQEFLQNRNNEAIIKLFSNMAEWMMDDFDDTFGEEFYRNGNLPQYAKNLCGIETFMSAAQNATNIGASPTSTNYAGLSCVPGTFGGVWNGGPDFIGNANYGWPNGMGDTQFDFWSPVIVDYGDIKLPGGAANPTWSFNCVEAISYGIIKSKKSPSKKGQLDLILMDDEMYRLYIRKQRAKERIMVNRGPNESDLVSLGFGDAFNQDGTDITSEYGCPPSVAYGWNFSQMELHSQQATLFVPQGPEFDMGSRMWRFSIDFYGNLRFNPKYFLKFQNYTNPSSPMGN
jgi:hypothetical protein